MIKLLANENFPKASVVLLRSLGYDVLYIAEDYSSIADSEIMDIAEEEERLIITFDKDYGELIFRHNYKPDKGVVYFRISEFAPDEPGKIAHYLLSELQINTLRKLTVYTTQSIRQRSY